MDADPNAPHTALPAVSPDDSYEVKVKVTRQQQWIIVGVILFLLFLLILMIGAVIYLAQPDTNIVRIRDIMIIFMALEFMIVGLALMIMIVQLATLTNLLQNEVKPLLETTNETVNTLRGTALFLSDHLAEPVIKMNEYSSGLGRLFELFGLSRRR